MLTNPLDRLRINLGDRNVERADLMELSRIRFLAREGEGGISARDLETWLKEAFNLARNRNSKVLTPYVVDQAFQKLLDEGRIKPKNEEIARIGNSIAKPSKCTSFSQNW